MVMERFSAIVFVAGLALPSAPAAIAQEETVSREVVQALPSAEVTALNHALKRLAINGRNLDALIDAGNAALALDDADAALGFFGRALEVSPDNAQVKLGMATVFMRSERPVDALRYYTEAEQSGAPADMLASDRGLAYDLLGENAQAQKSYQTALAKENNAETRRRLALSYAISGDREGFNSTLRPLILEKDVAAYRARAFGLAILGDMNEAKGLVTTVIPRDLASRIIPYLEFMPRLTKAQQAAAANLGIFPKAAEIGRDDPAIIAFRAQWEQTRPKRAGPEAPASKRPSVQPKKSAAVAAEMQTEADDDEAEIPAERHWVQLAAGTNRDALIADWNRARRRSSGLLDPYYPHVVTSGGVHRLLAGPLDDQNASQELIDALARRRIDSLGIMTPRGVKVDKFQ